jgi:hypothetical protein
MMRGVPVVVLGTGGFSDPNVELIWGDHANPFPSNVYMRKTFVLGDTIPSLVIDHGEMTMPMSM